jgi:uncharacterized protein involved in type VI secretion and phage assembly
MTEECCYGKYRGTVVNNVDPQKLGRLQIQVPNVLGKNTSAWALPCVPYAGNQVGTFLIPPIGANIWVEFEAGNPNYPIWSGCFWGPGEVPSQTGLPQKKIIKTDTVMITFDDLLTNTITIETQIGMKIIINQDGISLDNGKGSMVEILK